MYENINNHWGNEKTEIYIKGKGKTNEIKWIKYKKKLVEKIEKKLD